jgi:hypothetical protein
VIPGPNSGVEGSLQVESQLSFRAEVPEVCSQPFSPGGSQDTHGGGGTRLGGQCSNSAWFHSLSSLFRGKEGPDQERVYLLSRRRYN